MNTRFFAIFLFSILFSASAFAAETAPLAVIEMNEKSTINVLANGDANVVEDISLTATAFAAFKEQYPQLSMFARVFEPKNMPMQIEDLDVKLDEFNNKITANYTVKGMAINKDSFWELAVASEGMKTTLSAQTDKAFVFTYADNAGGYNKMITTTINVPEGSSNASFDEESNKIKYELAYSKSGESNLLLLAIGILSLAGAALNFKFLHY